MRCMCGRASSSRKKVVKFFNKQSGTTGIKCCSVDRFTADCKCSKHYKTDGRHKMKRLKTRKERSQMKGDGKEASKTKLHYHYCRRESSEDVAHFYNCCHGKAHQCTSTRDATFPNVVPPAQEPSIITASRLIGHHGLFNHEVKSIDIERLLSEQRKVEKSGQNAQEKNHTISHPSPTSHTPSPFSSNYLLCADADEVVPFEKSTEPATSTRDGCREKEKRISHGSDITPGQKRHRQPELSSGSYKSILSSKHSSIEVITKCSVTPEVVKESLQTPTVDRDNVKTLNKMVKTHMISTRALTPTNQVSPAYQTQAHGLSSSPPQLFSSPTADSSDAQHRRQEPGCVSQCIGALAARFSDCLQFPLLRRRDLVAESREVLWKDLRERHGPQLKENLLQVQQCLSSWTDLAKTKIQGHHQEPTMMDENELLFTDPSAFQNSTASQSCFETSSFKILGTRHFSWKPSLQPHQSLEQTAEWMTIPVDTSASFLDDILRPRSSLQFCMDFEAPGASTSDHLFAPLSTSFWGEKASPSQRWEDRFNRPESRESVIFDCPEKSFMNHTRAESERCCGTHNDNDSNTHPFFPYKTQLPDRQSAEPMHFSQLQDPFETDRYSFAPSFSTQIHHSPHQSNHFQPLRQLHHPSTFPPPRSYHTDMMHYPPSHTLERDPAPGSSSLFSPKHWSFPPMKLY